MPILNLKKPILLELGCQSKKKKKILKIPSWETLKKIRLHSLRFTVFYGTFEIAQELYVILNESTKTTRAVQADNKIKSKTHPTRSRYPLKKTSDYDQMALR